MTLIERLNRAAENATADLQWFDNADEPTSVVFEASGERADDAAAIREAIELLRAAGHA